jgi:predicted kinase
MASIIRRFPAPWHSDEHWADERAGKYVAVVSSDLIRKELTGDIQDQSQNTEVFRLFYSTIKNHLREGRSVIADSTALDYRSRREFRAIARMMDAEIHAVVWRDADEAMARNLKRERVVPDDVMLRMKNKLSETLAVIEREFYTSVQYV